MPRHRRCPVWVRRARPHHKEALAFHGEVHPFRPITGYLAALVEAETVALVTGSRSSTYDDGRGNTATYERVAVGVIR